MLNIFLWQTAHCTVHTAWYTLHSVHYIHQGSFCHVKVIANLFYSKCKAHTHFFVKVWLVRPLIKQTHNSSTQYLSNVTFGTSLEFQMRKEYVFSFFFKWISMGVLSGVMQLHTHFRHASKLFWALNRKT